MQGYWNNPTATATAAARRAGWMHTGDLGFLTPSGYLTIVDRAKDMIITGGENVYSAEVENALASHPAVAMSAVIGLPDERWGEKVHAVVVRRPNAAVNAEELRQHCRDSIAGYKVPGTIDFADALPISAAGKILKHVLRETCAVRAEPQPASRV
jgi:acyl-CoA synthetase (AMP-forming)/AMP-acid ligase II